MPEGVRDRDPQPRRRGLAPRRLVEELPRAAVGLDREGPLVLPLRDDVRPVGLRDAGRGAPRVLVPQQHLAPGLLEAIPREARGVGHSPEGLGLDEPPRGRPGQDLLARAREGPVLPVGGQVAALLGEGRPVSPLEGLEEALRRVDDEARGLVARVPLRHELRQLRVHGPVVPADRVADLDELVRVAALRELARVVEDAARGGVAHPPDVPAVEPGVAAPGDPHQQALAARGRDPPEGPVAVLHERPSDAVAAVGLQVRHVVRAAREVAHAGLRQRAHRGPGQAGDVGVHRDRGRLDPVETLQPARRVRPPGELLRVAEAGQEVREVGGKLEVAALHGLGERRGARPPSPARGSSPRPTAPRPPSGSAPRAACPSSSRRARARRGSSPTACAPPPAAGRSSRCPRASGG